MPPLRMVRLGKTDMNIKLLKAFYHRGRKTFVPWLSSELARKMNEPHDEIIIGLRHLAQIGYARARRAERDAEGRSTWSLTELGKAEAEQIIRADEIVRAR